MTGIDAFDRGLPMADLQMHIEGSIEPEGMLGLAVRNGDAPTGSRTRIRSSTCISRAARSW